MYGVGVVHDVVYSVVCGVEHGVEHIIMRSVVYGVMLPFVMSAARVPASNSKQLVSAAPHRSV